MITVLQILIPLFWVLSSARVSNSPSPRPCPKRPWPTQKERVRDAPKASRPKRAKPFPFRYILNSRVVNLRRRSLPTSSLNVPISGRSTGFLAAGQGMAENLSPDMINQAASRFLGVCHSSGQRLELFIYGFSGSFSRSYCSRVSTDRVAFCSQ